VTFRVATAVFVLVCPLIAAARNNVGGVTFANDPKALFVSARQVSEELKIPLDYDPRSDLAFLGSIPLDYSAAVGDQRFISVAALKSLGALISNRKSEVSVRLNGREMRVRGGKKRAVVDKASQTLRVYQGGSLVLTSRVSTGKYSGSTPAGTYRVGYTKDAYKASSKYGEAPMPFAVRITGNVFIHGGVVPNYPASHGCVRLPHDAAQWFYNWVEPGTVVTIR
jgi:lipoprotein-anchoring transpeptidase ErfK/SrfK